MLAGNSNYDFVDNTQLYGEENSDEDEDDERQHEKLLASVVSLDGKKRITKVVRSEPSLNISEFNTIEGKNEKIKVHELLSTLKQASTTDFKKQVRSVSRKSKILPTPLPRVAAERIKRSVAYEEVGQKVSKWDSIVASNRLAEHIEFPLKQADLSIQPTKTFVSKFKPKTPLELEVAKLLNNSPHTLTENKPLSEAEEKCLKAMSYEEAKEKLNELRKMRALLSYQEAKARRQKKIKSKRYHRILKKDRIRKEMKEFEELKKTEPEKAAEKLLEIDKLRIEERMSLKHKSTGKWAKQHALRAKYDKESRDALSEQLEIGKKLTEKRLLVEDSEESDNDFIPTEKDEPNTNNGEENNQILPSSYNPWFKDPFKTDMANKNEKSISPAKANEMDTFHQPKSFPETSNVISVGTNNVKNSEEPLKKETESKNSEEPLKTETEPNTAQTHIDPNTKELDIDEIFEIKPTTSKSKKKARKRKRKNASLVPKPIENVETQDVDDKNQNEELITETLEKKDKMEDFETYEPIEIDPSKIESPEEIVKDDTAELSKKVQVDPTNFVMVKAKNLNSQMPKQIEDLNNDDSDIESEDEETKRRMTISEAFADDDVLEEFKMEKQKIIEDGGPKAISSFLPGWGSWGGVGIKQAKKKKRRFTTLPPPPLPRQDRTLGNVIMKENLDTKKVAVHMISELPYPFTNVEQFERSLAQPIGKTWNPESAFASFIQPKVEVKRGKIIEPMDSDALIVKHKPKFVTGTNENDSKISFVKGKPNNKRRSK